MTLYGTRRKTVIFVHTKMNQISVNANELLTFCRRIWTRVHAGGTA